MLMHSKVIVSGQLYCDLGNKYLRHFPMQTVITVAFTSTLRKRLTSKLPFFNLLINPDIIVKKRVDFVRGGVGTEFEIAKSGF